MEWMDIFIITFANFPLYFIYICKNINLFEDQIEYILLLIKLFSKSKFKKKIQNTKT